MPVTRADIENDRIREALRDSPLSHLVVTEAALEACLEHTLSQRPRDGEIWLFAYGSLVWNPMVEYEERCNAILHGYHRGFYLRSRVNRGTPENPGLVLALDHGGACRGIAYRIARAKAERELRIIWRRENPLGSYIPRWVPLRAGNRRLRAIAFVINRDGPGYAGRLPENSVVEMVGRAAGLYGTCAEYLLRTVEGLERSGIPDARLVRLRDLLLENGRRPCVQPVGAAGKSVSGKQRPGGSGSPGLRGDVSSGER